MADKSISQLSPGVAVTDTDLLPNVQVVGVGPVKTTAVQIKTYVNTDPNVTGVIKAQLGSAAAPSYTFDGDLNTGWWSPAADTLAASTGGTERMRINASGNVGLGVTPSAWSSGGTIQGQNSFIWSSYDASLGSNYFYDGSYKYVTGTYGVSKYEPFNGSHKWYTAAAGTAGAAITFTQAMTLNASGNLGIGTTSPSYRFHAVTTSGAIGAFRGTSAANSYLLVGNSAGDLVIQANASGDAFLYSDVGKYLAFGTNGGSEHMRITSTGNVGIGQISVTAVFGRTVSVTGGGGATLRTSGSTVSAYLYSSDGFGVSGLISETNHPLVLGANSTERIRITAAGNVGIGTISPLTQLQVGSVAYSSSFFGLTGGNAFIAGANVTPSKTQRGNLHIETTNVSASGVGPAITFGLNSSQFVDDYVVVAGSIKTQVVGTGNVVPEPAMVFSLLSPQNATTATLTERMRIDSAGNVGIGVTPSAWGTQFKAIEGGDADNQSAISFQTNGNAANLHTNSYYNAGYKYKFTGTAGQYTIDGNSHVWYIAPSGTANAAITFTQAMTLAATGNLAIGTTNPFAWRVVVSQAGDQALQLANSTGNGNRVLFSDQTWSAEIVHSVGNLLFRPGGGSTDKLTIDGAGNVVVNNAAIATNAANGFLYVPGCAGAPTGTPTAYTGRVPIVVDTTNNKLYFYSGGAWRDAGP